jgi:hypothetical protein
MKFYDAEGHNGTGEKSGKKASECFELLIRDLKYL